MNDLTQLLAHHGGLILFAVVFVERGGLPLPAAPWLLAAGALSATGKLNLGIALAATTLACVAADWIWFYVGQKKGARILRLFCRVSLSPNSCVKRSRGVFAIHGLQGLALAKFIPVLGAVMPPLAGALGMSTGRFLLFDGLGSVLYAGVYIVTGFCLHGQLEQAIAILNRLGLSALWIAPPLFLGYLALRYGRRRRPLTAKTQRESSRTVQASASSSDAPAPEPAIPGRAVSLQAAGRPFDNLSEVKVASTNRQPHWGAAPPASCQL